MQQFNPDDVDVFVDGKKLQPLRKSFGYLPCSAILFKDGFAIVQTMCGYYAFVEQEFSYNIGDIAEVKLNGFVEKMQITRHLEKQF